MSEQLNPNEARLRTFKFWTVPTEHVVTRQVSELHTVQTMDPETGKTIYVEKHVQVPREFREMVDVDWVEYAPLDDQQSTKLETIVSMLKPSAKAINPTSLSHQRVHSRWRLISRAYDEWKNGCEISLDGTPIDQWDGADSVTLAVIRDRGLMRTVEEFAHAPDATIRRIALDGMAPLQARAKEWVGKKAVRDAEKGMLRQAREIAAQHEETGKRQQSEIAELRRMVETLANAKLVEARPESPAVDKNKKAA
jgi:hypothetical protein